MKVYQFLTPALGILFLTLAPAAVAQRFEESLNTEFQFQSPDGDNFVLTTSEPVEVFPEAVGQMTSIITVQKDSPVPVLFTVSGFGPSQTLYKYVDDYHNLEIIETDQDGTLSWLQDVSQDHLITIQDRPSTKFIADNATGGDCSLIGTWDNTTKTCTLTQDVNETIQIDSSGVTLDGGGFKMSTTSSVRAVFASAKQNLTVRNMNIENFVNGIYFFNVDNSVITDNIINRTIGTSINLESGSTDNQIRENTVQEARVEAIRVANSSRNIVSDNILSGLTEVTSYGVFLSNTTLSASTNEVRRNIISGFVNGIVLSGNLGAISLFGNTIAENTITGTRLTNIDVSQTSGNLIEGNSMDGGTRGVFIRTSGTKVVSDNIVRGNRIKNASSTGLILQPGASASTCRNNQIYNNDFIGNATQVSAAGCDPSNLFNLPLPDGGNYWSDFDTPAEGCFDTDSNGFCGAPKTFLGGQDGLPSVRPFTEDEPQRIDPVIIIPGILGSWQKNGEWVIDPVLHTYDNLIATFDVNHYTLSVDLFTFPYDWRESNVITALKLQDKINEVQTICECDKVDLVAHSMGGLIARQYIQSSHYEGDVDQLIFLATPHLGSPDSYLSWEAGELKPQPGLVGLLRYKLFKNQAKDNDFDSVFDYVRNYPITSIQQLLSTQDYIRDDDTGIIRTYSNDYPINSFLENLNTDISDLDQVTITNIIGILADETINTIRVVPSSDLPKWEHGYPENFTDENTDRGLEMGAGDGTVPLTSAEYIDSDRNYLESSHNKIVTDGQSLTFQKLTGDNPATLITGLDYIDKSVLFIELLSPVDVLVTAPDGKRVGKDFETGEEINEIPGAFYSGFLTDDEYVTIPDPLDGEYTITVKGTDSGEYTVATGYITEDELIENDFVANTFSGLETSFEFSLDSENPENIVIEPVDNLAPEIIINLPEPRDYLRGDTFAIDVSISDEYGIFSSAITLDGVSVNNGEIIDLFFKPLGDHVLSVTASDYVGNTTTVEQHFRSVATLNSMLLDIDRLFATGEIKAAGARDSLKSKINDALASRNWKKVLTSAFLKELDYQLSKNRITQTAYNLLKEDYQWVISH